MKIFSKIIGIFWSISIIYFIGFFNSAQAYQEILIENRGGHAIRVIKVILDGEHYVVSSIAGTGGETIQSLTKKVGGVSAINGAFFCPKDYANCNTTFSYYERVFKGDGESYSMFWPDTSIRAIFGFDRNGDPLFVQNKISNTDAGLISNINSDRISDLYFGISNFPVLLINGDDVTAGSSEYIDSKMTGRGNRNFICSTQDNTTIYMGVIGAIDVRQMASYLKEQFGCYNALFLDAGASTAMVYSGIVLDQGSRTLITDAFVVVDREQFIKLGGNPKSSQPIKSVYTMTKSDKLEVQKFETLIDLIYDQYGKKGYKTKLISMFRGANNQKMSLSKRAIYTQVLIYLFTIGEI